MDLAKISHANINSDRQVLVVSGVGMTEGGILSVLRNVLNSCENLLPVNWSIVALVHDAGLFDNSRIEFIEFPDIKRSWIRRVFFELVTSRFISERVKASVWFSLHDMTTITLAPRQFVYAHNPSSFITPSFRDLYFDPKFFIHSLVYKHVYGFNIRRNTNVFVQQLWIKKEFEKRYDIHNVKLSYPGERISSAINHDLILEKRRVVNWVYPTFPRHFKNIEVLCEAMDKLAQDNVYDITISITIDGTENRYAKSIFKKYSQTRGIKFVGLKSQNELDNLYKASDGLIFPSVLETWGLPLTEAKEYRLPILAADLPYARETVGGYVKARFFDPRDANKLSELLVGISLGHIECRSSREACPLEKIEDALVGWNELVKFVCNLD